MTIEEIEGLAKKYNDIFPNSNESKMFNFLLSEVKRLQGLYELELERAKKAEAQHFDVLVKNQRLREGIEEVLKFNDLTPYGMQEKLRKLLEDK